MAMDEMEKGVAMEEMESDVELHLDDDDGDGPYTAPLSFTSSHKSWRNLSVFLLIFRE